MEGLGINRINSIDQKLKDKSFKFFWVTRYYYILAIIVNFSFLFWGAVRVGVICGAIMIIIVIDYILRKKEAGKYNLSKTTLLIFAYIFYNLYSILIGVINGYSPSIGIGEFSNGILPIIFYFIALEMGRFEESRFVKSFLYSCFFIVVVGIYMYFVNPSIYLNFLERTIVNYYLATYLSAPRMHSFSSSVVVASIASMGYVFVMYYLVSRKRSIQNILLGTVLLIGIILTMQRSAMVFAMMTIILMLVHAFFVKRRGIISLLMYIFIVLIVFAVVVSLKPGVLNEVLLRISSMSDAIDERNSNWGYALTQGIETLGGSGLGTRGHRGRGISDITILDGNYFKMIFEIGLVGTLLFVSIMISTLIKGLKNFKKCGAAYICIVIGILVQAVGSSTLGFQLVMPMFWFAIGRVHYQDIYLKKNKKVITNRSQGLS